MRGDSTGEPRRQYPAGAVGLLDSLARGAVIDLLRGADGEHAADLLGVAQRRARKYFADDRRAIAAAAPRMLLGCAIALVASERTARAYQGEASAEFLLEMEPEGLQHLPPAKHEERRRAATPAQ